MPRLRRARTLSAIDGASLSTTHRVARLPHSRQAHGRFYPSSRDRDRDRRAPPSASRVFTLAQ